MSGSRRVVVVAGAAALAVVGVIVLVRTLQGHTDWSVFLLVGLVEVLVVLMAYSVLLQRRSAVTTRRELRVLRDRVDAVGQVAKESRSLLRAVEEKTKKVSSRVARLDDPDLRLRHDRGEYAQVEALLELRSLAGVDAVGVPMPALRGWAASPTSLLAAVRAVLELRPDLVVECGSGSSSVWIGHVLRRLGHGRYVALEHSEEFARVSRAQVARHGLADVVEVRHAPLVPVTVGDVTQPWYDPAALADLEGIGVVFVDGPPQATAPRARVPAVPILGPRCVPGAIVLLDDAHRPEERAAIEQWVAGGATLLEKGTPEKSVAVLRLDRPLAPEDGSTGDGAGVAAAPPAAEAADG